MLTVNFRFVYTVECLNKGHVGDNINSLVLSFSERLSSSRRLWIYWNYRKSKCLGLQSVSLVQRSIIHYPNFRGSTIGDLTCTVFLSVPCQTDVSPTCPAGWVSSTCGSHCGSTCEDVFAQEPVVCPAVCISGCFCPQGLVVYRDRCVDPKECFVLLNSKIWDRLFSRQ